MKSNSLAVAKRPPAAPYCAPPGRAMGNPASASLGARRDRTATHRRRHAEILPRCLRLRARPGPPRSKRNRADGARSVAPPCYVMRHHDATTAPPRHDRVGTEPPSTGPVRRTGRERKYFGLFLDPALLEIGRQGNQQLLHRVMRHHTTTSAQRQALNALDRDPY